MFSDADALLDAIWANPGDDTPRLVYADWMEDHGYGDYAQFIRLSCKIARSVMPPDERSRARHERYQLGQAIKKANPVLFPANHPGPDTRDFGIPQRSFGTEAAVALHDWPHWWPYIWPRVLSLRSVGGCEATIAHWEYLPRLETLAISGLADGPVFYEEREEVNWHAVSGRMIRELVSNPALRRLTALWIEPLAATASDLLALSDSYLGEQLDELHLWIEFSDGEREDLTAQGQTVRQEITDFVAAYRDRLCREA